MSSALHSESGIAAIRVLAHEPSNLLRRELYIIVALLGVSTYTALASIGIRPGDGRCGRHHHRVPAARRCDYMEVVPARISPKNSAEDLSSSTVAQE